MNDTVAVARDPTWIKTAPFDFRMESTEFVVRQYNVGVDEMEYYRFADAASFKDFVCDHLRLTADSICRWADKQDAGNV